MKPVELNRNYHFGLVIRAVLLIGFFCLQPTQSRAALFNSVPPIEGVITDATTGQTIESAVLVVRWMKTVLGPTTIVMKKMYVATEKSGVFKIPAFSSFHVFSKFTSVILDVRHPLHSTVQLGISREGIESLKNPRKKPNEEQSELAKYASLGASGEIIFNFTLLSLNEKFKEKPRTGDFHGALDSEFLFEGPKYFSVARQLGLTVNADAIFKEWDEIAGRFPDAEYIQRAVELGKGRIAKGIPED